MTTYRIRSAAKGSAGCWLLALLLLRALVPAGFMVEPSGGHLSMVLCTGAGPVGAPGGATHPGPHAAMDGSGCPFAQSASPALAFACDCEPARAPSVVERLDVPSSGRHCPGSPRRAHAARAPPIFVYA